MRQKLLSFMGIVMALSLANGTCWGQSITLLPAAIPSGIAAGSGEQYHQRFNIGLGSSAQPRSRAFTITLPPEVTLVANTVTVISTTGAQAFVSGFPTVNSISFGTTGTTANSNTTVQFSVTTPASFANVSIGAKIDTFYLFEFNDVVGIDKGVTVAKHNSLRIQDIEFTSPAPAGETTTRGGRFFKLEFPSSLPDYVHTHASGALRTEIEAHNAGQGATSNADGGTDIAYSFYLSTDPDLVERPLTLAPAAHFALGANNSPLSGTRQNPRYIPATYIREDFTTVFGTASTADSVNAVISLAGTADNTTYYVYVLADPAPDRTPAAGLATTGGASAPGYDPTQFGQYTGGVFLGRSGPLLVKHPPEFVIAGWDYDDDGNDDFETTGIVQVPSEVIGMAVSLPNTKDNRSIAVDSGRFMPKGTTVLSTLNSANVNAPKSIMDVSMLYVAEDADDPANFQMNILLSTTSGLQVANLTGSGIASFTGGSSITIPGTDTLTVSDHVFEFDPIIRDPITNRITSFIPENTYFVYYVAMDGSGNRTVYQVTDDPFSGTSAFTTLTVAHSPNIEELDTYSLNDFGGDGDLDVVTGISPSPAMVDRDGRDLNFGPAQRFVNIFWGGSGLDSDLDVDDNAQIDLFYSTRTDFKAAGKSFGYTTGNADGTDLMTAVQDRDNDTHFIGSVSEDADDLFDDSFAWDLWTYTSAAGTIPRTGVRYYLYALMTGGSTRRLISFTESGKTYESAAAGTTQMGVVFEHPPYIRPIEPSQDITVTVDEPVNIQWEAYDVDNGPAGGLSAAPLGSAGRTTQNSRNDSPNIRILLSSTDFGQVTTWATITNTSAVNTPVFVGNSVSGQLGATAGTVADEIELNEGVDSSFVLVGNRMVDRIGGTTDLGTNSGLGGTYFVYLAINDGNGGATNVAGQMPDFGGTSPVVRAPGRITFTGIVPAGPPSNARFTIPKQVTAVTGQVLQIPIVPDEGDPTGNTTVELVNLFFTVDPSMFEAVDTDPNTAGTQPFVLGPNGNLNAGDVNQGAYLQPGTGELRLDFMYNNDNGLNFFDGTEVLATLNIRAIAASGEPVATTISLDNSGTRVTRMLNGGAAIGAAMPAPVQVNLVPRAKVTGTVPLQGRVTSADTVTFLLREVGDLNVISDALWEANDILPLVGGVQVQTYGPTGSYTLNNVPSGRFVMVAWSNRYLAGHDTLEIEGGKDVSGFQPTLDGFGVDRTALLAGDAAGYDDATGNSIPDNAIDADDISAIDGALFALVGEAAYNTFADINRDGVVNGADRSFATANQTNNMGTSGIRPVFPHFKQAIERGDNAEARLTISGFPAEEVRAGETFDVTVSVEGAAAVRTYEFHLSFDPSMLAVEDVVPGSLFESYVADMGGKVRDGDLGLVNSILGLTPVGASGEATLATVSFRAINRSAETVLELTDALLIDVEHEGATPELAGEAMVVLSSDPIQYHDAAGETIFGLILAETDPKVDFNDFVAFAASFGTSAGMGAFDHRADFNGDDNVDFADFLLFSENFGRVAVDAPSALRASKIVLPAGVNTQASISLQVEGEARMGETLALNAQIEQAQAVQGWGFTVQFDPTMYEFVEAIAPESNLLESAGAKADHFLVHSEGPGEVTLASAIGSGNAGGGEGAVAQLVFRPIGEFEDAQFDIANGVVFDPNQLANVMGVGETLEIRAIPSTFALHQNFPNPFNPQTTIAYDLAEGGQVQLDVYNVMGQVVKSLVTENQPAGRYRIVWNGDDGTGRQVASGIYFYRLNTSGFKAVRKLMLLK